MNKTLIFAYMVFASSLFAGCKKETANTLTVTSDVLEFSSEGNSASITLKTDADLWNISNPAADWLTLSKTSGTEKTATVDLNVSTKTITQRSDTLIVTAGNAKPIELIVSQAASEFLYTLTVDVTSLTFKKLGNAEDFEIITDAPNWTLGCESDWLVFSQTTGAKGSTNVSVTALENTGSDSRSTVITLTAELAPTVEISVSQSNELYPGYNTTPLEPDASGMSSTALELAANISLGWNIGNSLEATGGETSWGNPKVSRELIDLVKQSGFNAIRIPCAWDRYMVNAETAELKTDWLNRVKEVVQYCTDNDMYAVLNIHWDGGWLENNCNPDKQNNNNAKQKAFWEQIATHLRDFDEHLLFASANEPNVDNATQMAVLLSYHQTFVDAVRSTGGKNSYRVLVVQGPSTDIDKTNRLMKTMPTDVLPNKMMVEIHYYTPWNFCGMDKDESWGNMFYYWGTDYHSLTDLGRNATYGEELTVTDLFKKMKTQFVDKGIPVILGEYGAIQRSSLTGEDLSLHLDSRAYYLKYVTQQAKANGILPFYWDNGGIGNNSFGIFDRKTNTIADQQALDALVQGATE